LEISVMSADSTNASIRRMRPTPSLIISLFALLIAMSTGAYAAVTIAPKNSVVSTSIKDKNVTTQDLADKAVSKGKLEKASVNSSKIVDGSVKAADIGDSQVGLNDLSTMAKAELGHGGPAYSTHFEAGVPLSTTSTTIMSLSLPAGSYVLLSKAQIDTFNNGNIIGCDLVAGSVTDVSFVQGGAVHESQIITNNLVATLATNGSVALRCQTAGGGTISQGRLTAITVSTATNTP
jgi:hypothetical protein